MYVLSIQIYSISSCQLSYTCSAAYPALHAQFPLIVLQPITPIFLPILYLFFSLFCSSSNLSYTCSTAYPTHHPNFTCSLAYLAHHAKYPILVLSPALLVKQPFPNLFSCFFCSLWHLSFTCSAAYIFCSSCNLSYLFSSLSCSSYDQSYLFSSLSCTSCDQCYLFSSPSCSPCDLSYLFSSLYCSSCVYLNCSAATILLVMWPILLVQHPILLIMPPILYLFSILSCSSCHLFFTCSVAYPALHATCPTCSAAYHALHAT